MSDGVLYNDRVLVFGRTRSGKSELINHLFTQMRSQRVLVDTKDEWTIADVEPVRSVDAIDWDEPVIHFIDSHGGADEFDELFERAMSRRRITMFVHEGADLCEHRPGKTGRWVNAYLTKGAAHGRGMVMGSQRPVNAPSAAFSEVMHVFHLVPKLTRADDQSRVAESMDLSAAALATELRRAQADLGQYAFLWWDTVAQELSRWGPLPDEMRRAIVVSRRTVA